eukprot:scaffold2799_cov408-Prasinococcus_capsulatus_cf.AAC.7
MYGDEVCTELCAPSPLTVADRNLCTQMRTNLTTPAVGHHSDEVMDWTLGKAPESQIDLTELKTFVPEQWLLRHVGFMIHNGSSETTAAAIHAGLPSLVFPSEYDHFFWGNQLKRMGLAFVLPLEELTVANVAPIITKALLQRESMAKIAHAFKQACSEEKGSDKAALFIHEYARQTHGQA